ncbi:beta-1,6-N-acetylglucosaminyltransferase [Marinomonas arenicola]|uniref:beta-1,6-N-acetylglucosaminyltransferase n=1 Tax=Marinomonas arenicola TaxID=569601 RepID=UPI00311ED2FA
MKMRVAFLIQCHKVTNALIYNIKKFTSSRFVDVYIHVDLKVDIENFDVISHYENVFFIKSRVNVKWGGVSQIHAALNSFYEIRDFKYDYISFMSGDEVFYKSVDEFIGFLSFYYGKEFIGFQKKEGRAVPCFEERVDYIYPDFFYKRNPSILEKLMRRFYLITFRLGMNKNKKKCSLKSFYKGSNWFTLTGVAVDYILSRVENESEILSFFERSFCGDEVFFQSIIMDSLFKCEIFKLESEDVSDNDMSLRYIDWDSGPDYPKVFEEKDLIDMPSKDCFFVRKVAEKISVNFYFEEFGK